jgi:hypothetical protein
MNRLNSAQLTRSDQRFDVLTGKASCRLRQRNLGRFRNDAAPQTENLSLFCCVFDKRCRTDQNRLLKSRRFSASIAAL